MSNENNGENFHVSVASFAIVEDVTRRIKESGGTLSVAAALVDRSRDESSDWDNADNAQHLLKVNATLECVEKLQRALTFLQIGAITAHAIARRNAAYIQNSRGIKRLPDEVLSRIFGFFFKRYDNYWQDTHAKELNVAASVCMRFRLIVLSMSQYWSRISSDMHPKLVDMHLVQSGNHPLAIVDGWNPDENSLARRAIFYDKIRPCMHRWESLSLKYRSCGESDMHSFTRELKGLSFPSLRKLYMEFPTVDELDRGDYEEEPSDEEFHVYRSWVAPSLRELEVENTFPRATECHRLQLTSCTVEIGLFGWCRPHDALGTLMSFLESQPSLEEFYLNTVSFPDETDYPEWKSVRLPALKKITLTVRHEVWEFTSDDEELRDTTNFFAPMILSHLDTPSLEYMDVEFILQPDMVDTFEFSAVFPEINAYTHLETLKLAIYHTCGFHLHMSPFPTIFMRMENLKHLYLLICKSEVSSALPIGGAEAPVRPPPLRTLHLDECQNLSEDCLSGVIEFLSQGEMWNEFEELKVTKCPSLGNSSAALSKWLEPGKVKIE